MNSQIGKINKKDFLVNYLHSQKWITDTKYKTPKCHNCDIAPICLYDYCPGKRIFTDSLSLPCPFEKYFLDSLLILLSKNAEIL